ncbi:MAG TPA: lamin tail domain-containing protein [Ktedonobacterales bacterium]|nr:lamin tail domain-containing protein [Ktedonobacterales bacterium]
MDALPSAARSPHIHRLRHSLHLASTFHPQACARLACAFSALLLMVLAGSALLIFSAGSQATHALAATTCPISNLPPTPTSGGPLDASSIKLNEVLTNPKKDWNCDGKTGLDDQWIELVNTSGNDESLFGLQLGNQNQIVLLNSTYRIAAHGYLVIFSNQIPTISLSQSYGQLKLLDSNGASVDSINYPPLGIDQSYARSPDGTGQWQTTTTPTPGAANIISIGAPVTPKATATKRSGGSGGGGGGGGAPAATPTPFGSVFIPTNTPSEGVALQNTGGSPSDSPGSGTTQGGVPDWLKIALIAAIGVALLGVAIWYWRTWSQEPGGDG